MPSNTYYSSHNHQNLETTPLSRESRKLVRLPLLQLVEGTQSALDNQAINVDLFSRDRTSTAWNWTYKLKVIGSLPERARTLFEQSNNYINLQLLNPIDLAAQKTYRKIAVLGAANETFLYAQEWLERLREIATFNRMCWREPLVNLGIKSEIVLEWWHQNKKLTVYILEDAAEFIKVWGPDIDNEMQEGLATSSAELTDLWKWLVS